eukprot:5091304-Karenia_brevis.AAC.1
MDEDEIAQALATSAYSAFAIQAINRGRQGTKQRARQSPNQLSEEDCLHQEAKIAEFFQLS